MALIGLPLSKGLRETWLETKKPPPCLFLIMETGLRGNAGGEGNP